MAMKVVLISTTVLSAAIMLSLSTTDIVDSVPWIYNGVVSWLRPPYLYLVINCIIIAIVAASKLQSESEDDDVDAPPPSDTVSAAKQRSLQIIQTDFEIPTTEYIYGGVERALDFEELDSCSKDGDSRPAVVSFAGRADDATSNKENECVVAVKSMWSGAENNDARNYVKQPASARFSHRRNLKSSPEGRTVLGVSKPRKQDTFENTWKTMTEGRPIPISRHLKKSDTFERDRRHQQENTPPVKTMKKAETFKDRTANEPSQSPGSGGSGKARKEASLSQDDLNKRVEAFIKKFNQEMRRQRQESLTQYKKMIKH